jgi:hypothetical protein
MAPPSSRFCWHTEASIRTNTDNSFLLTTAVSLMVASLVIQKNNNLKTNKQKQKQAPTNRTLMTINLHGNTSLSQPRKLGKTNKKERIKTFFASI